MKGLLGTRKGIWDVGKKVVEMMTGDRNEGRMK